MDAYAAAALRWLAVGVIVGGAGLYYYNGDTKKHKTPRSARHSVAEAPKRDYGDSSAVDVAPAKNKVKKRKVEPKAKVEPEITPTQPAVVSKGRDEDVDNRAFAQMMANTRKGTSFKAQSTENRVKTVKQSKSKDSNASSTTGAEGDDDLSPALSPTYASNSVADMLEPALPGPSILSIKPSEKPVTAKKPYQPKPEQAIETKKQRQNRLKTEEKKALREESEKVRRAAEEKQRRTAREARGEPARNGIPVAPPANSAWTAAKTNGTTPTASAVNGGSLLDTFDETPITKPVTQNTVAPAVKPAYFPSEEEQEAWANEDAPWNTVESKKGKKKKNTADSDSGLDTVPVEQKAIPAVVKPATNGTHTNGYTSKSVPFTPALADSDWAA